MAVVAVLVIAGLTGTTFADAINHKTYWSWATTVTDEASGRGVTGTPTVLVDGQKLADPTAAALQQQVAAAAG